MKKIASLIVSIALCSIAAPAATFVVTSTNDSGAGTLRAALAGATTNGGANSITFNIAGTPPFIIAIQSGLPIVPPSTTIFADLQPGYTLTNPAVRIIPGAPAAHTQDVLRIISGSSEIRGLYISGFTNNSAIGINGGFNVIAGNVLLNCRNSVWINSGNFNRIGGFDVADRNVMSSNTEIGVRVSGFGIPSNTVIAGNFIGTSIDGKEAWPNRIDGVAIDNAPATVISGTSTAVQVISGNGYSGISIGGTNSIGGRIYGNFVGTDVTGTQIVSNYYGIFLGNAVSVTVGGPVTQNLANIVSGNDYYGIRLSGTNCHDNVVMGNYIGLATNGVTPVPNRYTAILVHEGAWRNRIGGYDFYSMNVIGGNGGGGVAIADSNTHHNVITWNLVGINRQLVAIPYGYFGYEVYNSYSNTVGPANYACNADSAGIYIHGPESFGNTVIGNVVGFEPSGVTHPNYGGIRVSDARDTTIGSTDAANRNYVSGNHSDGIVVEGMSSNTVIIGNWIGNGPSGTSSVSNEGSGIRISSSFTTVGGTSTNMRNFISGNVGAGVYVSSSATNIVIMGNYIGTDLAGTGSVDNGYGVTTHGPGTIIGGTTTNARNVIAGNNTDGVQILDDAHGTMLIGNYIGVSANGNATLSNKQFGVYVNNANNVVIGGTGASRNVISASRLTGIAVGGTSSNTTIAGNYIGTRADGMAHLGVGTAGIGVDADYTRIGLPAAGLGNIIAGAGAGAIEVNAGSHVSIMNNSVGIGADGDTNLPNARGIVLQFSAKNVQVGGTNALEANVSSRNLSTDLWIKGPSTGNRIVGNYIGVKNFGVAFPTVKAGICVDVDNSSSNWIVGNVIGLRGLGMQIAGTGSVHNVIQGNFIGEYNLEDLGNSGWGIYVNDASDNVIGGLEVNERNLIAHNAGGILVTNTAPLSAINNRLSPNLIFDSSNFPNIDIGPRGPNLNDAGDADVGANLLQNHPFITNGFIVSGGSPTIYAQGVLNSAPLTTYAIDIYRSSSTNAEAFRYLGRTYVDTDGAGSGTFLAGFPVNVAVGQYLVGAATDPNGNTSELYASPTGVVSVATGDTDGDLIPNYWETIYGLNPAVSNGPASDADSDGYTDLEEYIADTPANDVAKYPVVVDIANASGRKITFPSSSLRVYNLQYNDDITNTPAWAQLGNSVTGFFGQTTMTDTNVPAWRNYRVGVRLP